MNEHREDEGYDDEGYHQDDPFKGVVYIFWICIAFWGSVALSVMFW